MNSTGGDWRPLSEREAGGTRPRELAPGVPAYLAPSLRRWLEEFLTDSCIERVAARLGRSSPGPSVSLWDELVQRTPDDQLLDVVDTALFLCRPSTRVVEIVDGATRELRKEPAWLVMPPDPVSDKWRQAVQDLAARLAEAGSAYRLNALLSGLERRVDPTLTAAVAKAANSAGNSAAEYLRAAWSAAYGLHPNPSAAYRDAIRAVEAVVLPIALPRDPKPTLGKAIQHLKDTSNQWKTTIQDKAGQGTIDPVIAMLERLWHGQTDRHGGPAPTQTMAEAAVHLAATLVQWFASKAVTRQP
jgi:hypothetical protein